MNAEDWEAAYHRPTKSHEYLFLLAKSASYYYDADAIREPHTEGTHSRGGNKLDGRDGFVKAGAWNALPPTEHPNGRNRRTVWTIATQPFSGAHFATFPEALVEPCVLAGSRVGDTVFDPFLGSGTVAQVAQNLGRHWLGCELSESYLKLQARRTEQLGMALA